MEHERLKSKDRNRRGVSIAISSAGLISLTPIFGKLSINAGMFSIAVVASPFAGFAALAAFVDQAR